MKKPSVLLHHKLLVQLHRDVYAEAIWLSSIIKNCNITLDILFQGHRREWLNRKTNCNTDDSIQGLRQTKMVQSSEKCYSLLVQLFDQTPQYQTGDVISE